MLSTYNNIGQKEALYNILIEFGIPRKLVGLIKMCEISSSHGGEYEV
jgi:hypothetical protein